MKYLLALSVCFFAHQASAQQGITNVHEVALTTATVRTISLTTGTAGAINALDVALQTSSGTIAGYFAIEVYNPASNTDTVVCSYDTLLSTAIANQYYGREVVPGSGVYWGVPRYRKLYCTTKSSVTATRVTVSQFK